MSNIEKINSNFSVTQKIHDYIGNDYWKAGYKEVLENTLPLDDTGRIDFKNCPGYSTLWYFLSSAFDEVGSKLYEKISNIVFNTQDIETCNLHSLFSIA